jgi:hypothetical protein
MLNFHRLKLNFIARPLAVKYLIGEIKLHPFVGTGFNKTLNPDNMFFVKKWGWLYKHNDLLALASYLGIPSLAFMVYFIIDTIKKLKISWRLVICLTILITSLFQMTFFFVDKAVICLLILSVCITEAIENKKEVRYV